MENLLKIDFQILPQPKNQILWKYSLEVYSLRSTPGDFYIHWTIVVETNGFVQDITSVVQEATSKGEMVPIWKHDIQIMPEVTVNHLMCRSKWPQYWDIKRH